MRVLHAIRHRSIRAHLTSTGAAFCIAAGFLGAASSDAGAALMCVGTKAGAPTGSLHFRGTCKKGEVQLGNFDGQKLTITAPLGGLHTSAGVGVPGLSERGDRTTYQTLIYEATTDPNGMADILDDAIEEGSVYHSDVTLMARTTGGRAYVFSWRYTAARIVGSPDIQLFSTLDHFEGSIDPPPTSEVLAVGNRLILRVHGNGPDALEWSVILHLGSIRSKQSEAKANLKALFTAEKAFFQEKDRYSTLVGEVGFDPERGNRYRYVLTVNPVSLENRSSAFPVYKSTDEGISEDTFKFPPIGSTITQGPCAGTPTWGITNGPTFTAAAYGNIDGDNTLDVWTISTASRTLSGSNCDAVGNVASGEPANEQNDVNK